MPKNSLNPLLVWLVNVGWFGKRFYCVDLARPWRNTGLVDAVSKEIELVFAEMTFLRVDHQSVLF